MPQATDELRSQWSDDGVAFEAIRTNYTVNRGGIIYPRQDGYKGTSTEYSAIDYLCQEWDYGYSGMKP